MGKVVATAASSGPRGITGADLGFGPSSMDAVALPQVQRPYPFFLAYHPRKWQVMCGRIVPMLATVAVAPGLSGTPVSGGARRAKEAREERGWVALDPMVDGVESYIYSVDGARGPIYLSRWETAHEGSELVSCDSDGYSAWLAGLVSAGKIPGPQPVILSTLRATCKARVDQLTDAVRLTPSMGDVLAAAQADVAVVDEALKALAPKPITKRNTVSTLD